jgi:hypothetical protein
LVLSSSAAKWWRRRMLRIAGTRKREIAHRQLFL